MKYAVIYQRRNGDAFENLFDTQQEAIAYADRHWKVYLTKAEKAACESYTVMYGPVDEDGVFDLDKADLIRSYPDCLESQSDAAAPYDYTLAAKCMRSSDKGYLVIYEGELYFVHADGDRALPEFWSELEKEWCYDNVDTSDDSVIYFDERMNRIDLEGLV